MLNIAREEKVPVEEAMARLRASPSSIDSFSPSRLFFGRELRNPLLPAISDGQDEELLGKQRQITKDEERVKRNTKVGKSLQRYVPKVGDLVLLQNQRTKRWDCPATVHLVRPGSRSAYVVAEDDGQMYLQSHIYLQLRQAEESANDAVLDPESDTVSTDTDDPALSHQTLAQASLACTQAVGNISIVRSNQRKLLPKNLAAQLALSCTEEVGQSSSEQPRGKRSGFFSPVNTLTAGATRETSPAEVIPQKLASLLIVVAGNQHLHMHSACPPTERMTMPSLKAILITLAMLVALALATGSESSSSPAPILRRWRWWSRAHICTKAQSYSTLAT